MLGFQLLSVFLNLGTYSVSDGKFSQYIHTVDFDLGSKPGLHMNMILRKTSLNTYSILITFC